MGLNGEALAARVFEGSISKAYVERTRWACLANNATFASYVIATWAMAAGACGRCPCSTLIRLTAVRWDPDVTDRLWEMSNAMDMLEAFEDRSRAA